MNKIWHISDSHSYHELLRVPEGIDTVIFSGDESNYRDAYKNKEESLDFIEWFSGIYVKNKIMIAGNHSSAIEKGLITKEFIESKGIHYLENSGITIDGVKIWGSPYTPTFGFWSFMKARQKLYKVWQKIPIDTDIIVVHGPPKGFLDLTYDVNHNLTSCGCNALKKVVFEIKPNLVLFGHIHNNKDLRNAGVMKVSGERTLYSNASVVTDGKFGRLSSNGNIINYNKKESLI